MKATVLAYPEAAELSAAPTRLADYVTLTKPRIALLVLFTVATGTLIAAGGGVDPLLVFHTVLGTALVAAGASALNHLFERHTDALMRRTENRPLPAGRLQPWEVLLFGLALGVAGVIYLAVTLRQPWPPVLAALTYLSYVGIYTPLKSRTTLNTLIGAVPGALPPVIGWSAVRDPLEPGALVLFLIVFLWQIPHFMAIAWMYRQDYGRAGLFMVPVFDRSGGTTARHMGITAAMLLGASLVPGWLGGVGVVYLLGAAALGGWFLLSALRFAARRTDAQARRVLRVSLWYLPGLLTLLLLDGLARAAGLY